MKSFRSEPTPRILKVAFWVYLVLGIALIQGCGERIERENSPESPQARHDFPHPVVQRDWIQIRKSGVLRIITFYNSRTYFIHKGGQAGFDYELIERFAGENGLTTEIVIAQPGDDLISMLNSGQGDVICSGLPAGNDEEQYVALSRPTGFSTKVAVFSDKSPAATEMKDLAGMSLTIPWGCPFSPELQEIRRKSEVPFRINQGPSQVEAEELMTLAAQGRLQAVVVDNLTARAGMAWIQGLQIGPALGPEVPTVWMVRKNSTELGGKIDKFLKKHLWINESGRWRHCPPAGRTPGPGLAYGFRSDVSGIPLLFPCPQQRRCPGPDAGSASFCRPPGRQSVPSRSQYQGRIEIDGHHLQQLYLSGQPGPLAIHPGHLPRRCRARHRCPPHSHGFRTEPQQLGRWFNGRPAQADAEPSLPKYPARFLPGSGNSGLCGGNY